MEKELLAQWVKITGRKEMNRLVNLLVQEGYEVVVFTNSYQRENKTDKDRGYIVKYVHPDFDNCRFAVKESK